MKYFNSLLAIFVIFSLSSCKNYTGEESTQTSSVSMDSSRVIYIDESVSFYDDGNESSEYSNNKNYTITLLPKDSSKKISIDFNSFSTEPSDTLTIYDGNTRSNILGIYSGTNYPSVVTSTSSNGALTIDFKADSDFSADGWVGTISTIKY